MSLLISCSSDLIPKRLSAFARLQGRVFPRVLGVGRSVFTCTRPKLHATVREARQGCAAHTVVLSHALGQDHSMWDLVANRLIIDLQPDEDIRLSLMNKAIAFQLKIQFLLDCKKEQFCLQQSQLILTLIKFISS